LDHLAALVCIRRRRHHHCCAAGDRPRKALREPPPRNEIIEGVAALAASAVINAIIVLLPAEPWETVLPAALMFPILLWLAAVVSRYSLRRRRSSLHLRLLDDDLRIGHFADPAIPIGDRILSAQAAILGIHAESICFLRRLFAEKRHHEAVLEESEHGCRKR